jgi:hypothetical protein
VWRHLRKFLTEKKSAESSLAKPRRSRFMVVQSK